MHILYRWQHINNHWAYLRNLRTAPTSTTNLRHPKSGRQYHPHRHQQNMHLPSQDPSGNLPTCLIQRRTPGRANLQTTTPTAKGTPRTCTRMAIPHIQNLKKNPHHKDYKGRNHQILARKTYARRHHKPWRRGRRRGTLS